MNQKGFTMLEVLVVIAIIAIISMVIFFSLAGLRDNQTLNGETSQVLSIISEARSNTLSSKNDSQYGVHFATTSVTIFKGSVYSSSSPSNELYSLNTSIELTDIFLFGSTTDMVFERLTGKVNAYGTLKLRVVNNISKNRAIRIEETGISGLD